MPEGKHLIPFNSADSFAFVADPIMGPVRVNIVAEVVIHQAAGACEVREYRQGDDALAWVLVGFDTAPALRAAPSSV